MTQPSLPAGSRGRSWRLAGTLFVLFAVSELTARVLFSVPSLVRELRALGPHARLVVTLIGYASREADVRIVGQEWHPLLGWTNRAAANLGQRNLHINRQGLRATHDVDPGTRSKPRRIAVFGDSFVFGIDVGDEETYAAQLQARLKDWEVLNFGVPGYGLDQCLMRWRTDGVAYEPDVVVLGVMDLLFMRSHRTFDTWYKPYFALEQERLALHGVPVPAPEEIWRRYLWRPRLLDLVWILEEARRPDPPPDEELEVQLLTEFVLDVRRHGGRPVLVLHPASMKSENISPARFQRVCASTEVDCLDLIPEFERRSAAGENLVAGTHWSAAGHAIVARGLARLLAGVES